MKGFIEIHTTDGKLHLINVQHIVEVDKSIIYTDDVHPDIHGLPCFECMESYSEIKEKIEMATVSSEVIRVSTAQNDASDNWVEKWKDWNKNHETVEDSADL